MKKSAYYLIGVLAVLLVTVSVYKLDATSPTPKPDFKSLLVHLDMPAMATMPAGDPYMLGQQVAAALRIREHINHGQQISLSVPVVSDVLASEAFWAGFITESGDTWELSGVEAVNRTLRVVSRVHILSDEQQDSRVFTNLLERGAAFQISISEPYKDSIYAAE